MKKINHEPPKNNMITVNLTFDKETYELIERISGKLGVEPSYWINMVLLSKIKGIEANKIEKST